MTVEWVPMAWVSVAIVSLLASAQILRIKTGMKLEYTRKLVHFGAGLLVCAFPFIFDSIGSVALMSLSFLGIMVVSKLRHVLDAVHEEGRNSAGAYLYPMAVFLIFYWSDGYWLHFMVPILLLTIPDAAAALIGKEYGTITYAVNRQYRSLEGSFMFFLIAFLCILIPVLLAEVVDNRTAILVALLLALIITGIEAVSVFGVDNLFVPLVGFLGLTRLLTHPTDILIGNLAVLLIVFIVLAATNRWRHLTISGMIGLTLMLYAIYSWGGWAWFIQSAWYSLTFALGVNLNRFRHLGTNVSTRERTRGLFEISAVFHFSAVPLLILFMNRFAPHPDLFSLFTAMIGLVTGMSYFQFSTHLLKRFNITSIPRGWPTLAYRIAFAGSGSLFIYILAASGDAGLTHSAWQHLAITAVGTGLLAILQRTLVRRYHCPNCGRTVVTPIHCRIDTEPVGGIRYFGMWQGVLVSMVVMAGVLFVVSR